MSGMEVAAGLPGVIPQHRESCTAVLLAGGRSRRMGRDKAELMLGDRPLWQRQLETLQALQPRALWLSGRSYGGREAVPDRWPEHGPLGGLATVLALLETEWLVVLAIDLPLITSPFLREVLDEAQHSEAGVVPWDGSRFHPLAAVYPREAGAIARACVDHGDLAMQPFVLELENRGLVRRKYIAGEQLAAFANFNMPEDWEGLQQP